MIRLFLSHPLHADAVLDPTPEQARYLTGVMRLKAGDELLVFNGRDGEWRTRVVEVGKRDCTLQAIDQTRLQSFPPNLDLIVALVKRGALETIVEKATELGVRRIRLVTTRRTNADHTNLARLSAIAAEAAEQTGRLDVPEITALQKLDTMLADWPTERRLMFCDEAGDDAEKPWGGEVGRARPAFSALINAAGNTENAAAEAAQQNLQHFPKWAILIGPEGGFAPEERARLRALDVVTPVTLGPRILRADTAAIAALTLWQAAFGDWR
jgi:16S rRNA (uracil1498-N3)-methyltransferase